MDNISASVKDRIDRFRFFLQANPNIKGLFLILIVVFALPITIGAALTIQNLTQKASVSDTVKILNSENGTSISQTTDPVVYLQISLPSDWVLIPPEQEGAFLPIQKAHAEEGDQTFDTSGSTGGGTTGGGNQSAAPTPTVSFSSLPPAVRLICASAITISGGVKDQQGRGIPNAKVCLDPTATGQCQGRIGETDGSGTYIISGVTPSDAGHTVYLDPTSVPSGAQISPPSVISNTCPRNDIVNFTVSIPAQPQQSAATAAPNVPATVAPTATAQPGIPATTSAPTTHTLVTITIENKDNGTGGTILPPILAKDALAYLTKPFRWELNPLASNQSQAERVVQVTLFDGTNYVPFVATVTLNRTNTPTVSVSSEPTAVQRQLPQPTESTGEVIDTLDYFLTKHKKGLLGLISTINQDWKRLYTLKTFGNGSRENYELYTWDDQYIYLKEDRTARAGAYTFSNGIWMKRKMKVGEKITVNNNKITWYDSSCVITSPEKDFPYEITLEAHIPNYKVNGLPLQDVIVVKYDSSLNNPTNGIYEKFYYSREWGWIYWEEYTKDNSSPTNIDGFVLQGSSVEQGANTKSACVDRVISQPNTPSLSKSPPCFGKYNNTTFGYGDIDGDGVLTQKDYDLLRIGLSSLTPDKQARALLDGKTVLTATDLGLLGEYLGGKITTFPVCSKAGN